MITIDGSHGEGGGQILRSALPHSLVTRTSFKIEHIRARRRKLTGATISKMIE